MLPSAIINLIYCLANITFRIGEIILIIIGVLIVVALMIEKANDSCRDIERKNAQYAEIEQQEVDYKWRSSPENTRLRDLYLEDIIQRHRASKAQKKKNKKDANNKPATTLAVQRLIDAECDDDAIQHVLKILLKAHGIPVWLTEAKLAHEGEHGNEDRDEDGNKDGEISLEDWFE